ncbi:GntR family transcriptional regulator [Agromyces aerolatus]|uniref:GntR family transcriptional regulator n=1 Tax=Agromyces sp. LY-1074 TaxID=3074080 RepID=UPI00286745FA|nr:MULTISPECIES: GntR family transcriptional regulator [unclassified Agromyces]MDR5700104.1 GntR family transcriptional regulator [Agromyces sp. LY-1074]MDR5706528.1 GntR family transcriptional regulator [Agromyces sp. LY-1358]
MSINNFRGQISPGLVPASVADQVYHAMLDAIVAGALAAGAAVHDREWALALGVSRTPVREAIQRLDGLGLLDVAPARYTRLRSFSPEAAAREARDWASLHHALVSALHAAVPEGLLEVLHAIREAFLRLVRAGKDAVVEHFAFFNALREASPSYSMRLGATAAAYRLRLAEPSLAHTPQAHGELQSGIVHALAGGGVHHARHALASWINHPRTSPLAR